LRESDKTKVLADGVRDLGKADECRHIARSTSSSDGNG
jgi:hypothetical protein